MSDPIDDDWDDFASFEQSAIAGPRSDMLPVYGMAMPTAEDDPFSSIVGSAVDPFAAADVAEGGSASIGPGSANDFQENDSFQQPSMVQDSIEAFAVNEVTAGIKSDSLNVASKPVTKAFIFDEPIEDYVEVSPQSIEPDPFAELGGEVSVEQEVAGAGAGEGSAEVAAAACDGAEKESTAPAPSASDPFAELGGEASVEQEVAEAGAGEGSAEVAAAACDGAEKESTAPAPSASDEMAGDASNIAGDASCMVVGIAWGDWGGSQRAGNDVPGCDDTDAFQGPSGTDAVPTPSAVVAAASLDDALKGAKNKVGAQGDNDGAGNPFDDTGKDGDVDDDWDDFEGPVVTGETEANVEPPAVVHAETMTVVEDAGVNGSLGGDDDGNGGGDDDEEDDDDWDDFEGPVAGSSDLSAAADTAPMQTAAAAISVTAASASDGAGGRSTAASDSNGVGRRSFVCECEEIVRLAKGAGADNDMGARETGALSTLRRVSASIFCPANFTESAESAASAGTSASPGTYFTVAATSTNNTVHLQCTPQVSVASIFEDIHVSHQHPSQHPSQLPSNQPSGEEGAAGGGGGGGGGLGVSTWAAQAIVRALCAHTPPDARTAKELRMALKLQRRRHLQRQHRVSTSGSSSDSAIFPASAARTTVSSSSSSSSCHVHADNFASDGAGTGSRRPPVAALDSPFRFFSSKHASGTGSGNSSSSRSGSRQDLSQLAGANEGTEGGAQESPMGSSARAPTQRSPHSLQHGGVEAEKSSQQRGESRAQRQVGTGGGIAVGGSSAGRSQGQAQRDGDSEGEFDNLTAAAVDFLKALPDLSYVLS